MQWVDPLDRSFWIRVGLAVLCGGLIGLERQLRGKPAGIRTSAIICLGTMLFVRLGAEMQTATSDPARVLGQVITGIGFLGAGVILTRGGLLQGVTSAAVIWLLAGIGSAIGLDRLGFAAAITGVTLAILSGVRLLERGFSILRRGVHAENHEDAARRGGQRRRHDD